MEFLSFDDGVIRVERYRDDVSPSRRRKNAKVKPFRDVSGAGINSESSQNYCLMPHKVPFAFQPQKALFKDFDIGKTYSITVTLTNVTKGFSTFRAMPISPIYSDILDVDYIPPPRISAGLSWKLKINFRPVEERNISTELHLKSECGSFYVPIRIQRKRAVISIDPQKVDFGTVVIGETRRKKIVIRNDGASCGSIHIAGTFRKVAEGMQVDPLTKQERSFLTINPLMYRVEVPPFSHREFELSFSPVEEVDLNCNIIFSDRTEGEKNFTIPIKGKATSLPVHVASEDLQMNWCFYGCTYSSDIILSNTSNVSAIASPEVDRSLREVIRFDPPLACVQPGGEFRIAVFFTPNEDLDSDFETTVDLHVKGQSLPATVKMFASLTKRQPDVSADSVLVGRSFINEEKLVTIDVSNASSLPQMVGFLNIPANVRITPDVATMLPLENMEFKICVTAPSFGQYAQQLTLYNEYGDRRTIKLSGYGVEPKLLFSDSTISLPPCAINSSVTATTVLTNTSLEARQFAFMVGCDFIRISPSSGSLKPGESIPIVIFFIALPLPSPAPVEKIPVVAPPPKSLKRRKSNAKAQAQLPPAEPIETVQTKVSTYEDWNASEDCPWSRHKNIIIRCVSSGLEEEQYYLQLMCTVVKPDLVGRTILFVKPPVVIDQPTGRKKSGKISKKEEPAPVNPLDAIEVSPPSCSLYVDFGEVSLNRATVQTCFIRNDGGAQLSLQLRPVDPLSPFTVIKLPKSPLDQGEEEAILIQFMPTEYGTYSDIITFATDSSNSVDVYVYGACCCTELAISFDGSIDPTVASKPESIDSIQFATTKKGDACQVPLWFYNFGTFPLDVSIQVADPENTDWILKRTLFFQPSMFSIPPNGKLSAAAIFCPQQDGEYSVEAKVKAGGYEHKLLLDARGSSSGVYCVFPKDDRWSEVITGEHSCVIRRPPSFGRSVDYPLSLHFLTGETKTFTIGSVKMGPPVECVIEKWDESFAAVGWVVEPMKLTVLAGAQGTLRVTLRQPDQSRKILVPYCLFAITLKCSVDPSNDRTYYVRCTGP